jgi:hypothetical protein
MSSKKPALSKSNIHNYFNDIARGNKIANLNQAVVNNKNNNSSGKQGNNLTPKR